MGQGESGFKDVALKLWIDFHAPVLTFITYSDVF